MTSSFHDDSQWFSAVINDSSSQSVVSKFVILDPLANEYYQVLLGELLNAKQVQDLGFRWVVYVDVVGVIRTLQKRENYYLIDLDDGTGCLNCTIWRHQNVPKLKDMIHMHQESVDKDNLDLRLLCDQLTKRCLNSQPTLIGTEHSELQIGQTVQLRGRLKLFRQEIKLSAYFCRLIYNPNEYLQLIIHRQRLHSEVYSKNYDPQEVAKQLKKSKLVNLAHSVVDSVCRILDEDGVQTFTKLDLCLHPQVVDVLNSHWITLITAFDEHDCNLLEETCLIDCDVDPKNNCPNQSQEIKPKKLQLIIDHLVDRLLNEGWIYHSTNTIGSLAAYHTVIRNTTLQKAVLHLIKSQCEISQTELITQLRHSSTFFTKLNPMALDRVLDYLQSESQIFQSKVGFFKAA